MQVSLMLSALSARATSARRISKSSSTAASSPKERVESHPGPRQRRVDWLDPAGHSVTTQYANLPILQARLV